MYCKGQVCKYFDKHQFYSSFSTCKLDNSSFRELCNKKCNLELLIVDLIELKSRLEQV